MADLNEKILKALEDLKQGQERLEKTQQEQGKRLDSTATKDDIEHLENGQTKLELGIIGLERGLTAIKELITLLNSNFVKITHTHEKRLENLEEQTGTTDPTKH